MALLSARGRGRCATLASAWYPPEGVTQFVGCHSEAASGGQDGQALQRCVRASGALLRAGRCGRGAPPPCRRVWLYESCHGAAHIRRPKDGGTWSGCVGGRTDWGMRLHRASARACCGRHAGYATVAWMTMTDETCVELMGSSCSGASSRVRVRRCWHRLRLSDARNRTTPWSRWHTRCSWAGATGRLSASLAVPRRGRSSTGTSSCAGDVARLRRRFDLLRDATLSGGTDTLSGFLGMNWAQSPDHDLTLTAITFRPRELVQLTAPD